VQEFLLHYLDGADEQAQAARLVSVPAGDIATQKAWVTGKTPPVLVTLDSVPVPVEGSSGTPAPAQPAR
jgi:hypothetical protein